MVGFLPDDFSGHLHFVEDTPIVKKYNTTKMGFLIPRLEKSGV